MKKKIIDSLITIGAVKFGEFRLKSGTLSPIYVDLRIIVSYPRLLTDIAAALFELTRGLGYDRIAGIPYTALPIATAFSLSFGTPMIYARKERKAYGTGRQIEGIWKRGDRILLIDDLVTNGISKGEAIGVFEQVGLAVEDIAILIDREQGGRERLEKANYRLHSLISIFEILDRIKSLNKIDGHLYNTVSRFLRDHRHKDHTQIDTGEPH